MRLEVIRASLDEFFPGVFAIGLGTDTRPPRGEAGLLDWRLSGALSNLVRQGLFEGNAGENMLFWSRRRRSKVFIFGTGASSWPSGSLISDCAGNIARVLMDAGENEIVLLAEHLLGFERDVERALAFLSGFLDAGKRKPEIFSRMHMSVAGDSEAESYYEVLKKAVLRKGKEAEVIELVFTEGMQGLQPSVFMVNH